MEAFYSPNLTEASKQVILQSEEAHHLSRVLRIRVGEKVLINNGEGLLAKCEIQNIKRDVVICNVIQIKKFERASKVVNVLIPLLKQTERFEFAIEKLTELGVDNIQPIVSERTIKKNFKKMRIEKIVISAIKQSQNPFVPKILDLIDLHMWLENYKEEKSIILYGDPEGKNLLELKSLLESNEFEKINLIVGPEGDFSDFEKIKLRSIGGIGVNLGPMRLRSETAIITLTSQLRLFIHPW